MSAFVRLLRLHQPAGILLLFWPCAWSLALHAHGFPDSIALLLFILGAVLMRGAGCILNDVADRTFDIHIERTQTRPLATGEVRVRNAVILAAILLGASAPIAIYFGTTFTLWAMASLPLVIAYPYMKRFTYWPQAFLGLTFSWGTLLASVAVTGHVTITALLLYVAAVFWTLGYDTIYAYQDMRDDEVSGIKSSALLLKSHPKKSLFLLYSIVIITLVLAGATHSAGPAYYVCIFFFALVLVYQISRLDIFNPKLCMKLFRMNAHFGWLPFLGACLNS